MNRSQKVIIVSGISVIAVSIFIWLISGSEIFTKTQVLIEKKDDLFGWTEKQWVNKFVLGLDYTLALDLVVILISVILIKKFKTKAAI